MSTGLVRNLPLLLAIISGDSGILVFREIINLIPSHSKCLYEQMYQNLRSQCKSHQEAQLFYWLL